MNPLTSSNNQRQERGSKVLLLSILFVGGLCTVATALLIVIALLFPFLSAIKSNIATKATEFLIFSVGALWASIFSKLFIANAARCSPWNQILVNLFGFAANIVLSYSLIFSSRLGFIGCCISFWASHMVMFMIWAVYLYNDSKRNGNHS
jgi:hypothetical protein